MKKKITFKRMQKVFGGELTPGIAPECPHCHMLFGDWMRAKVHVKFCGKGTPRKKSMAQRGKTALEIYAEVVEEMKLQQSVLAKSTQLMPNMLASLGDVATIAEVRPAGKEYTFSDVCIDLLFGKKKMELPIKSNKNEDFKELAAKLGLDTDKWNGKKIHLYTEEYTAQTTGKVSDIIRFELATK